jgi:hypothetical protein
MIKRKIDHNRCDILKRVLTLHGNHLNMIVIKLLTYINLLTLLRYALSTTPLNLYTHKYLYSLYPL